MAEEFETSLAVVPGLDDNYFTTIVENFIKTGRAARGLVGEASPTVVEVAAITTYAVDWLKRRSP